ncbi:MAG: SOS response-associated peptidase [Pseudomonadota bacterium]|nr:SOS response-associated peptidase [Pseudomonadota bacterium]
MCGRYSLTVTPDELYRLFGIDDKLNLQPRFNVAPTQAAPVVRKTGGKKNMDMLRWGLIPPWSKDVSIASKLINARGETVAEKPSFRSAYESRRCLVPVDGFYEWRTEGGKKQPFRIGFREGKPFAFAGLWESWTVPEGLKDTGDTVETFTIVTTNANPKLVPIHHRMPVIVDPTDYELWLEGGSDEANAVIKPFSQDDMAFYRVSTRVNNVRNDDEACVEPLKKAS